MKRAFYLLLPGVFLGLLACGESQDIQDVELVPEELAVPPETSLLEPTENTPQYYSRGINPDGSLFSAGVSVDETGLEGTYLFTWYEPSTPTFVGVGMDLGENLIVVGTEGPMLRIYERTQSGYSGVFFTGENLGKEVLSIEQNEDPFPAALNDIISVEPWPGSPAFEMSGTNPDGSEYTGIIQTRPLGVGAQILWTQDGGHEFSGGALMLDDETILAAYSVGIIAYELIEENIWRGEWYSLNNDSLGVEWITPLDMSPVE